MCYHYGKAWNWMKIADLCPSRLFFPTKLRTVSLPPPPPPYSLFLSLFPEINIVLHEIHCWDGPILDSRILIFLLFGGDCKTATQWLWVNSTMNLDVQFCVMSGKIWIPKSSSKLKTKSWFPQICMCWFCCWKYSHTFFFNYHFKFCQHNLYVKKIGLYVSVF